MESKYTKKIFMKKMTGKDMGVFVKVIKEENFKNLTLE